MIVNSNVWVEGYIR